MSLQQPAHRRSTLASGGPAGNSVQSGLPVPSSAVKGAPIGASRSERSRQSVAPYPKSRISSIGGPSSSGNRGDGGMYGKTPQTLRTLGGSTAKRPSHLPASGRASMAPSSVGPRASMAPGGRQSMAPGYGASAANKDPRPVRNHAFQQECQRNVMEYIAQLGVVVSSRFAIQPTGKDFQTVFKSFASELVGEFPWGKKFEDDAIAILRDLRYPFMETVGKTALSAAGSQQTWPAILAMLSWLAELCRSMHTWEDPTIITDPAQQTADELPVDTPAIENRLLWDFCAKTYDEWFDGEEEFPRAERELEESFDRLAAATVEECEKLEREVNSKSMELAHLQTQVPPLLRVEDENHKLNGDRVKFLNFIGVHEQKQEKMRQGMAQIKAALAEQERINETLKQDLRETETAVAAQNLSPDEVQRMNHDKESLRRQLDELDTKINEINQAMYDQEMHVTRAMDRFDQLQTDYNALAQMALSSDGFFPEALEFALDINLGADDLSSVREEGRTRMHDIRRRLQEHGESSRRTGHELQNEVIAFEHEHDLISAEVQRQQGEVTRVEQRLKFVQDQAEIAKNRSQKNADEANRTIASLQNEVETLSTSTQQELVNAQSELQRRQIAYQELQYKTKHLQETLAPELLEHMEIIVKVKEHANNCMLSVRQFAEAS